MSTKQSVKFRPQINDDKCSRCANREETALFTLCVIGESAYMDGAKLEHHTTNHMRTDGDCGTAARLFKEKT